MDWFNGTVEDSIKKALGEDKIFIVYIEGENEESKKMIKTWNDGKVAKCCAPEKCVAIKLKAGSLECDQFSQFYPVLYIPSTYLINQSGVPTDIIPGFLDATAFISKISGTLKPEVKTSTGGQMIASNGTSSEQQEKKEKGKSDPKSNEDHAREAIKMKIEQDKAEKKAKYEKKKEDEKLQRMKKKKEDKAVGETTVERRTATKIQFRFANGSAVTKEFPVESTLSDLVNEIKQIEGFENSHISLATVYPRHQFQEDEMALTLLEANLVPNAALFVIQKEPAKSVTSNNSILDFIKFVLAPVLALFMYIKVLLFSKNEDSGSVSPPMVENNGSNRKNAMHTTSNTTYKKEGKIYKFRQENEDDEDKEKKTWNGNSTQQM